jgi:transcriptional regulator GlxA family with amidase domain
VLRSVAVVLQSPVALFELAVLDEVFGIDRTADGVPRFDYRVCGERPGVPVPARNGLTVTAPLPLAAADDADLVAVPASDACWAPSAAVVEVLRAAHARGARVLSVCSGAFALGAAGLLDGRRCTTHWLHTDELAATYPAARVDPGVLYTEDDRVVTSAGTAAGIDACLHLVRTELGAAAANAIARRMVVPPHRDGGQRQFLDAPVPAHAADSLAPLTAWLLEHLAERHAVADLARRARMSERTFARRFVAETGTTPHAWLTRQRVRRARELLEGTELPVDEVAAAVGLGPALLRQHLSADTGLSPTAYRRRFRTTAGERGAAPVDAISRTS